MYKIDLVKKKTDVGGIANLLNSILPNESYQLWNDPETEDLSIVQLEDGAFEVSKGEENQYNYKLSGFYLCKNLGGNLQPTEVNWECDNDEYLTLSVVYLSDMVDGLFIKIPTSKGVVVKKVLGKESYNLDI